MPDEFLRREVPALKKDVFRLGLAVTHGIDGAGVREALAGEMNYVFWNPTARKLVAPLREALRRDRERFVVSTGPTFGWFGGSLRRRVEAALRALNTDYLDVLQLYWLGKMSALTSGTIEEMVRLREAGKVRALGASIHDRPRAGRLAEDSVLDLLMIRYNAAHPGAESEIFPHLARRRPAVVAYTATCWGKLLRPPRGYSAGPATAGQCYRFCLSSPHVDLVLCSPGTAGELREDLAEVAKGPLAGEEMSFMRALGRAVHGSR
ncbi:MAG TPA: aldo/keto reductase [Anaeromyxobacteraceae bacterium]|nr:aldo/keto reductase [Anaeromyxobacteraceae bacterium]